MFVPPSQPKATKMRSDLYVSQTIYMFSSHFVFDSSNKLNLYILVKGICYVDESRPPLRSSGQSS
jgi:hypothetical protein